ncbi:MAG: hypothetical protein HRT77_17730 [Halioglobus sp.]|nr:hypothetical protein [Halioglobus sp.]
MTYADVAIVDETAMDAILPATGAGEARLELMRREFKLSHVVALTDEKSAFRISVASEEAYCADGELPVEARWTALTALVYGLIWRWDMTQCLALARRAALFTAAHGDAPVPPDLLDAAGA